MLHRTFHHSHFGHRLPFLRKALHQVGDFDRHTQAHFAKYATVFIHEVQDDLLLRIVEIVILEQLTRFRDLLDAQIFVAHRIQGKIQIVATRLQRIQVILEFLATQVFEFQVRNEDDRTFEVELIGNALALEQRRIGSPEDPATLTRIQRRLEQIQAHVIEQDRIAVVEHQDAARVGIFVERSVQANRRARTFDDFILDALVRHLIEQARFFDLFFHAVALANSRRTDNDHCADARIDCGFRHFVEDAKPLGNPFHHGFFALRRVIKSVVGRSDRHRFR